MTSKTQRLNRDTDAQERFPPLSTSLDAFIHNGSDTDLRRLIYELASLSALMVRNREHFATYIGTTDPQYLMLAAIADDHAATVSKIAGQLGVSSQFVTTETAKLEAANLIGRAANPDDRRSMILRLTEHGRTLLRELAPIRRRINDLTFKSLTRDRAAVLQSILADLIADARSANHELLSPDLKGKRAPSAVTLSSPDSAKSSRAAGRSASVSRK